ncbi:outer membrane protein OmpK [Maricaulis alexandrii]|uniref:outer membrane protein OmpK n=1 Tax=Maricaulis alexandrii TaxID=2570354 RepID=UPI001485FD0F|nr:outer membrane protein OmpK [Maricaulis alexandrii]
MRMATSVAGALLAVCSPVSAQDFIEFHTENIQLLRGSTYELGDRDRTIITLEHANRWRYGDLFVFADLTIGDDGQRSAYGEISPRLSLSRMTGQDWALGLVSDVYLAGNFELGDEGLDRQLYGAAVDLDLPGFTFSASTPITAMILSGRARPGRPAWPGTGLSNWAGSASSRKALPTLPVPRVSGPSTSWLFRVSSGRHRPGSMSGSAWNTNTGTTSSACPAWMRAWLRSR